MGSEGGGKGKRRGVRIEGRIVKVMRNILLTKFSVINALCFIMIMKRISLRKFTYLIIYLRQLMIAKISFMFFKLLL